MFQNYFPKLSCRLGATGSGGHSLECGDLSPLSPPERLVAQAESRREARRRTESRRYDTSVLTVRRTAVRGADGTTSCPIRKSGDLSPHSTFHSRQSYAARHFQSHPYRASP